MADRSRAGDKPTKRTVTLRDDPTERVYVEWFAGTGTFTSIHSVQEGDELRMLAADSNELSQLLAALRAANSGASPSSENRMVRDMGAFERVYVQQSDDFVSLVVEELGEVDRMLILAEGEVEKLIDAVEQAEAELPRTEEDAHV